MASNDELFYGDQLFNSLKKGVKMKNIVSFLDGKKNYIGWAVVVAYGLLIHFGVVPSNELIWGAIGTYLGVTYRLAITKM